MIVDGIVRVQRGEVLGLDQATLAADALRFDQKLQQSVAQATYQGRSVSEFYEPAFPDWVA